MDPNTIDLSLPTPPAYRHKRARVSRACDQCRKKKIRCDADKSTPCSNCGAYGFGCTFLDSAKKRGPPKGYIEALENRLKRMEGLLGGLVNEGGKKRKLKSVSGNLYEEPEDIEGAEENDEEEEEEEEVEYEEAEDEQPKGKEVPLKWRTQSVSSISSRGARSTGANTHRDTVDQTTVLSSPPPSPEEPVEDINEGLEKLSMKDYTQTCYVGNSSGLYLIMSQFESKDGIYQLSKDHPLLRGLEDMQIKQENHDDSRTVTVEDYEDANNVNGLTDKLIGLYFTVVHPLFPILNKVYFLKQYRGELSSGPPALLKYAVLAVASKYLPKTENSDSYGQMFYEQAAACLDRAYMHPRISTVQALLLMLLYHHGTPNGSRNWLDCGLAIRMSQDLGLHRSSSQWKIPKSEIETRKRVWWTCYIMDRWSGAVLGRPFAINDDDCDVEYPSIYDESEDEDITSTPPTRTRGSFSPESSPPVRKPNIGYMAFVELIKISEILGRILHGLYTPKARARRSGHDKIIKNLDDQLTNWKVCLPIELQQIDGNGNNPSQEHVLYAGVVQMCYFTALILLHRPYIPSHKLPAPRQPASLRICTCAANAITKIAQILQKGGYFDSVWPFTVYHTFQSSLIHLHNTSNSSKELARLGKLNLEENIKVLESVHKSFHVSRKIVPLLKMLSKIEISIEQEPAEGGFWINVNKEMACGGSETLNKSFKDNRITRALTPRSQSTSQSPNLPTPHSDSFNSTPSQEFSTLSPVSDMNFASDNQIFLPTTIPLSTTSLSSSSPHMDSPGSVTSFLNEAPVYSLRQFAHPEIPASQMIAPLIQQHASFDQDMSFTFDLNNSASIELPNELFRIEQSNPFFSMPSTYNPEDWDVWMFGQGGTVANTSA